MPDNLTPKLKEFARRFLALEAPSGPSSSAEDSAAFHVCEKLRQSLSQLTGVGGFRSLLSRALVLAGAEIPWLRAVHVKSDGSLEGIDELKAKLGKEALALGEAALVARLLGLLVTFIGPALTLRLVQDIWPKIDDLNFETENGDEKK